MPENAELIMLQRKIDTHIAEFERQREADEKRWQHLLSITESNAKANADTAEAVRNLTEATRGLLEAWEAVGGAVKVGSALGSFIKWLSGFAVIGGAVAWVVSMFSHPPANGG